MDGNIMIDYKYPQTMALDKLFANDYNPNRMPDAEMDMLRQCIQQYGFLFPIIAVPDGDRYRIVDGYHRYETLRRMGATEALVTVLDIKYSDAIKLTVLMNRIKGIHKIEGMAELVSRLGEQGLEAEDIMDGLGMEAEEVIRLQKQQGISDVFKHRDYSKAWKIKK